MRVSLFIRFVSAFAANVLSLGAAAALFGERVQSTYFPALASDEPNVGLLLGGSALGSGLIAWLYPRLGVEPGAGWFGRAVAVAVPLGLLTYFATHLVQTGYTTVSATGWLLEGLYDSLAPMASVVAIAAVDRRAARR